jgi:hypothetical protein
MRGPAHLGELLAFRDRSSGHLARWLAECDPALAARLCEQAARCGETVAQFVRIAVADFLAEAPEEAWADLLSSVRDADDPGARCIDRMTSFRAAREPAP